MRIIQKSKLSMCNKSENTCLKAAEAAAIR